MAVPEIPMDRGVANPDNFPILMELESFGIRLKNLREEREFSQQELASRAGLTAMTVSKLERGLHEPSGRTVRMIAKALDIPAEKLRSEETVPLEIPRDLYNQIKYLAAQDDLSVVDMIARRFAPDQIVIVSSRPPQSEASVPPAEPRKPQPAPKPPGSAKRSRPG